MRSPVQQPGDLHLRRRHAVRLGDRPHTRGIGDTVVLPARAGEREERHERDALHTARGDEVVLGAAQVHSVRILHTDHRRDRLGRREVLRSDD